MSGSESKPFKRLGQDLDDVTIVNHEGSAGSAGSAAATGSAAAAAGSAAAAAAATAAATATESQRHEQAAAAAAAAVSAAAAALAAAEAADEAAFAVVQAATEVGQGSRVSQGQDHPVRVYDAYVFLSKHAKPAFEGYHDFVVGHPMSMRWVYEQRRVKQRFQKFAEQPSQ